MLDVIDEALRAELLRRQAADQDIRRGLDDVAGLSPDRLRQWVRTQQENAAWLRDVVARHGWPGRSLVGEDGARAAWLLVLHAERDPDLQTASLARLRTAARDGEATAEQVAYLTDRVQCARGLPQTYGTQLWYGPAGAGELEPKPIADPEHLDDRRAAAGLPPLADYLALVRTR